MMRRACATAHSSPLPSRLLTSAVRSCQPAWPYSRAITSCALRCVSGRSTFGRCARAREMAPASPAAMSRASFFACLRRDSKDGRTGRILGVVTTPPFKNRLYRAETRLKEGANAHDSDKNRWECSLAAGGWRPVSALLAVSRDCRFDVKRGDGKRRSTRGSLLGLLREWSAQLVGALRVDPDKHCANYPPQKDRGYVHSARSVGRCRCRARSPSPRT